MFVYLILRYCSKIFRNRMCVGGFGTYRAQRECTVAIFDRFFQLLKHVKSCLFFYLALGDGEQILGKRMRVFRCIARVFGGNRAD